jgi:hypothetical protein
VNDLLAQLTPQERRIVVAIGMVVIVVLNLLFVWPHFSEWGRLGKELQTMRGNIETYNKQIALDTNPTNGLQKQLAKLVHQEGTGVMDKQVQLQSTIMTQARRTDVNVANYNPGGEHPDTNGFFEEESIKITTDSQEPELVNFLYNIGGDPAMIRVSELTLAPMDQNRYRLRGSITLTANYVKRAPAPVAAPAASKPAFMTGAKPAATPASGGKPTPEQKAGRGTNKPSQHGQPFPGPAIPGRPGQAIPGRPGTKPLPPPFIPQRKTAE